uniref:Uncharacterized protein n=1 Tax=Pristionchus pacificus TaxID=54126 RepID=A0A2A6CRA0_PRIPA|eukprot:PDM80618.1 hypothetical protein PRIPAC_35621 [Pristionchus pacificus]
MEKKEKKEIWAGKMRQFDDLLKEKEGETTFEIGWKKKRKGNWKKKEEMDPGKIEWKKNRRRILSPSRKWMEGGLEYANLEEGDGRVALFEP